jgi:hypothetical protein
MNWLLNLFRGLARWFKTGAAARDTQTALQYVGAALPIVEEVGGLIVTATPTTADDAKWNELRQKYPELLDGQPKTPDALKLAALGIATRLLQARFPILNTSIARAAVQLAYIDWKNLKAGNK